MRTGYRVSMAVAVAFVAGGILCAPPGAEANNLRVTNTTAIASFPLDGKVRVQFDIAWDNSWRHAFNHDAAWVFFKYKIEGDPAEGWRHATLSGTGTNPAGYSVGVGTSVELIVPEDRKGLFVRRAPGVPVAGSVAVTSVQAVVHLADSGISASSSVRMQTMAIEMVYVAEGAFWAGDGTSVSTFTPTLINTNDASVPPVTYGANYAGGYPQGQSAPTNVWPNGFNAFYCMKYEITQGQYVDFLNTLTEVQAGSRYYVGTANRYTISGTWPNHTATRRDRACNFLSWADGAAFADWSGLRPMTELEFEKACRGPRDVVPGEYAWGTTAIVADASLTISKSPEDGTETITTDVSQGAALYGANNFVGGDGTTQGPLRVGIFATNGAGRVSAGASYWGIMELSGNLWERPVTIANTIGKAFTGLHGDGVLTDSGIADVDNWPPSTGANEANGAGYRGGTLLNTSANARASDRIHAAYVYADRGSYNGWRGVRVAPSGVGP